VVPIVLLIAVAASAAAGAGSPTLDVLGIHLSGAAAWLALLASLASVVNAVVDIGRAIWRRSVPLQVEAYSWSTTGPGDAPASALRVFVRNNTGKPANLIRFDVVYDPGKDARRKRRWHLGSLSGPQEVQTTAHDNLPTEWTALDAFAVHGDAKHAPLLVIAGFSRERVRAVAPIAAAAPIQSLDVASAGRKAG
jgi:hypothetical protein